MEVHSAISPLINQVLGFSLVLIRQSLVIPEHSSDNFFTVSSLAFSSSCLSNDMLQTTPEQSVIALSAGFDLSSNEQLLNLPGSVDVHAKDDIIVDVNHDNLSAKLVTSVASPGQSSAKFFPFVKGHSSNLRNHAQKQKGRFLRAITESDDVFLAALYLFVRIEASKRKPMCPCMYSCYI